MTVYVVAQLNFKDRQRYRRYQDRFMSVLERFSGRLLVADEKPILLEGQWPYDKLIVISFADAAAFKNWSESPEYREILEDRKAGADAAVVLVRGVAEPPR